MYALQLDRIFYVNETNVKFEISVIVFYCIFFINIVLGKLILFLWNNRPAYISSYDEGCVTFNACFLGEVSKFWNRVIDDQLNQLR